MFSAIATLLIASAFSSMGAGRASKNAAEQEANITLNLAGYLLLILNLNQLIKGEILFSIINISGFAYVLISALTTRRQIAKDQTKDFIISGAIIISIASIFYTVFNLEQFWSISVSNFDDIIYHCGAEWSKLHKLFVSKSIPVESWNCDFIGYDSSLNRAGTYTLLSWLSSLSPNEIPGKIFLAPVFTALVTWRAAKLYLADTNSRRLNLKATIISFLSATSTGIASAMFNSNVATAVGASALIAITAASSCSKISINKKYLLMATWLSIGICTYGETLAYGAGIVAFTLLKDLIQKRIRPKQAVRTSTGFIVISTLLSNISLFTTLKSVTVLKNAHQGAPDWQSWYLDQTPLVWPIAYINGLLMGDPEGSGSTYLILASLMTIIFLIASTREKIKTFSSLTPLIITTIVFTSYIAFHSYDYGEHKILQMLGPPWTFAIASILLITVDKLTKKELARNIMAFSSIVTLALINFNFLQRGENLVKKSPRTISHNDAPNASNNLNLGKIFIGDLNSYEGMHDFHYYHLAIRKNGGFVYIPSNDKNDPHRIIFSTYSPNKALKRDLKFAESIDTIAVHKSDIYLGQHLLGSTLGPKAKPFLDDENFSFYALEGQALIARGEGWYPCEKNHCWTKKDFKLEIFQNPSSLQKNYEYVTLTFTSYSAPPGATVKAVSVSGKVLATAAAKSGKILVPIKKKKWQQIEFKGSWTPLSPRDKGQSKDSRKLFLSIDSILVHNQNQFPRELH